MDADHAPLVAAGMRERAFLGTFDGRATVLASLYMASCRRVDSETGTVIIFTRDTGHHASGWMKNPDFERCLHLSLSVAPSALILPGRQRRDLDAKTEAIWVRAFFGDDARKTWKESGKQNKAVSHWRLFCDEHWTPIMPRGEVYSTELTELGWRSASQVLEEDGTVAESVLAPG